MGYCRWKINEDCPPVTTTTTTSATTTTTTTTTATISTTSVPISKGNEFIYKNILTSNRALTATMLSEPSHRYTVDTLARLTQELPVGTTCMDYSRQISCLTEWSFESDESNVIEWLYKTGALTPSGDGHQSVLEMPHIGQALATMISTNIAVTDGSVCAPVIQKWARNLNLETVRSYFQWNGELSNFLKCNKPIELDQEMAVKLAVRSHDQLYQPTSILLTPRLSAKIENLKSAKSVEEFLSILRQCTAQCSLIFSKEIPDLWPACNPLDNGQFGRKMDDLKSEIKWDIGQRFGMDSEQVKFLTTAYEDIINARYINSIWSFSALDVDEILKQCYIDAVF